MDRPFNIDFLLLLKAPLFVWLIPRNSWENGFQQRIIEEVRGGRIYGEDVDGTLAFEGFDLLG